MKAQHAGVEARYTLLFGRTNKAILPELEMRDKGRVTIAWKIMIRFKLFALS